MTEHTKKGLLFLIIIVFSVSGMFFILKTVYDSVGGFHIQLP